MSAAAQLIPAPNAPAKFVSKLGDLVASSRPLQTSPRRPCLAAEGLHHVLATLNASHVAGRRHGEAGTVMAPRLRALCCSDTVAPTLNFALRPPHHRPAGCVGGSRCTRCEACHVAVQARSGLRMPECCRRATIHPTLISIRATFFQVLQPELGEHHKAHPARRDLPDQCGVFAEDHRPSWSRWPRDRASPPALTVG